MFMTAQQAATAMSTYQVVAVGEPQLVLTDPVSPRHGPKVAPVSQYRDQLMSQLAAKARKNTEGSETFGEDSDDSDQKNDHKPRRDSENAIRALRSGKSLIGDGTPKSVGLRWNTADRVWERV